MSRGRKSRNWVFTINNPVRTPEEVMATVKTMAVTLCVFQEEKGEEGTRHYQGYLQLKNPRTLGGLVRVIGNGVHLEMRRGTKCEAITYCMKEDTRCAGPWFYPSEDVVRAASAMRAGAREDIIAFKDQIKTGMTALDLWDNNTTEMAKYYRMYESLSLLIKPEPREVEVRLYIGKPGTGKTRSVHAEYPDHWASNIGGGNWYDGYDHHQVVLLDDFSGARNHISVVDLLRLIDRYVLRVPVKGSFRWWCPKVIIITTNDHPSRWYDWQRRKVHYAALQRRISTVLEFTDTGCVPWGVEKFFEDRTMPEMFRVQDERPGEPTRVGGPLEPLRPVGQWRSDRRADRGCEFITVE